MTSSVCALAKERRGARSKGKGCWYFISTAACPICGREEVIRKRRAGPKPKDWHDTHEYIERWDYCNAL